MVHCCMCSWLHTRLLCIRTTFYPNYIEELKNSRGKMILSGNNKRGTATTALMTTHCARPKYIK